MSEHNLDNMDPAVRAAVLRDQQRRKADPRIAHHVARIEAEAAMREAEADRRAAEAEAARQQAARDELEAERQRRLEDWMRSGNDPSTFPSVWAKQQEQIFLEQQDRLRRQQQESSPF